MKKISLILFALLTANCFAQQLPQSNFYFFNTVAINPAISGTDVCIPVYLSHRMQWLNFNQAPTTQNVSVHGAMNKSVGLGAAVMNHTAGATSLLSAQLSYSYRLSLNEKYKLSFGVAPMILQHALNKSKLTLDNPNDNTFNRINGRTTIVDVNAGVFFYSDKMRVGFSAPQLFGSRYRMGDDLFKEQLRRHFNLHFSYDFKLKEKLDLTPWLLVKAMEKGAPVQIDLTAKLTYQQFLWGGLGYRFSSSKTINEAALVFVGLSKANFSFAYCFDYSFSSMMPFTAGSHEIMLSYKLCKKKPAENQPLQ